MWLEIKQRGEVRLLNTKHVSYICKHNKNDSVIIFLTGSKEIHLECANSVDCAALIQGFILALNGLDFKAMGDDEIGQEEVYIKPLKDDANEALYKYMKLKELLGDRK